MSTRPSARRVAVWPRRSTSIVVLSTGAAVSSAGSAGLAGAMGPPAISAVARAKKFWLIVPAREVEDKTLAVTAIKPSKRVMRIVRVESERIEEAGRFGAVMSSKTPEGKMGIHYLDPC